MPTTTRAQAARLRDKENQENANAGPRTPDAKPGVVFHPTTITKDGQGHTKRSHREAAEGFASPCTPINAIAPSEGAVPPSTRKKASATPARRKLRRSAASPAAWGLALPPPTVALAAPRPSRPVAGLLQRLAEAGVATATCAAGELELHTDRVLGEGAFGTVYGGGLRGRPVAVKEVGGAGLDEEKLADLEKEVLMAHRAAAAGPAAAAPLAVAARYTPAGQEVVYVAMELYGGDLQGLINGDSSWVLVPPGAAPPAGAYTDVDDNGDTYVYTLPPLAKRHYARQTVAILQQLKAAGVVHRDLKPQNCLLGAPVAGPVPAGGMPCCQMACCDFGEAFVAGDAHAFTASVAGTRGYIPPEADEEGAEVGHPADVYAAGVLLCELWCGAVWQPIPSTSSACSDDDDDVDNVHDQQMIADALDTIRSREPEMARVISKCLARNPAKRPSVEALSKSLDDVFRPQEVLEEMADMSLRR